MFTTRWQLFRLCGIPLYVHPSWLLILALVTLSLTGQFRAALPELPPGQAWFMGLTAALVFFACIVLHELGHALTARANRMPIRGITLFLFGGVAELVGEPPSARVEFAVAIAGPVVSALLSILFWALTWAGAWAGWPPQVWLVLGHLAAINLIVLVFNLVPAFPLDGGRVLRSALWAATGDLRRATRWASLMGQGFALVLIGLGVLQFFAGNWPGGVWMGLIGLFLLQAARASYEQVVLREALRGEPVRRFMNPEPVTVDPLVDLGTWVEDYVYRHHRKAFPVTSDGRLEGVVTTRALGRFPRAEWGRHTVAEAMETDLDRLRVSPETDALDALERMQRTGSSRLVVADGRRLVGIVSLKDLLGFLRLKLELEPG